MKSKIQKIAKNELTELKEKKITRKQAIKKTGYIALSAATMMMLISIPKEAHASPQSVPPW